MDKLWAPWRLKYIQAKKTKGCIFCRGLKNPKAAYIVFKTEFSFCMLNIYPYNNGHVMVSPIRHVGDLSKLKDAEMLDLFKSVNKAKFLLDKVLRPKGYNLGVNIGSVAGAGVLDHLHIHVVPRYLGDTNFMPVVSDTKVLSQSLEDLHKKLTHAISS